MRPWMKYTDMRCIREGRHSTQAMRWVGGGVYGMIGYSISTLFMLLMYSRDV